ncbi:MAG: hypothetical protein R2821_02560 [Flavobacteriaceae bacterium]
MKSKPVNTNYDSYKEFSLKDYTDFEAEIYKTNMLGLRKKKIKESVQQLKEISFKIKKITYYLDFPVKEGYTNGNHYSLRIKRLLPIKVNHPSDRFL